MTAAEAIETLVHATRVITVALGVILAMRPLVRRTLGVRACYWLWWLAPTSLLATLLPTYPDTLQVANGALDFAIAAPVAPAASPSPASALALAAWLSGSACMAAWSFATQRAFERSLGTMRRRACAWFSDCDGASPVVLGALRPRLVLPGDFCKRFGREERRLILAHERIHIMRGDLIANAIVAVTRCLFWFHPLVHYAMAHMRQDQEIACDAVVVARNPHSRRTYGEAMLKTLAHVRTVPIGANWGDPQPIKERIRMLTQPAPHRSHRILGALLLGAICSATVFTAWATTAVQGNSYSAKVTLDFENGAHKDVMIRNALGKPFTIRSDEGGSQFSLVGTVTSVHDGAYDLRAEIRNDEVVSATPHLVTSAGKVARMRIGDKDATGAFRGTTVSITLSPP